MFTAVYPGALRSDPGRRVHGRAWSKSLIRVVAVIHDELISMGLSRRETDIAPPHFGQCHSGVLRVGAMRVGSMRVWSDWAASRVRASAMLWLRKRLESRP